MLIDCSISYNKIYWESWFRRCLINTGGVGERIILNARTPRGPVLAAATRAFFFCVVPILKALCRHDHATDPSLKVEELATAMWIGLVVA
jgi:hypothetical protein